MNSRMIKNLKDEIAVLRHLQNENVIKVFSTIKTIRHYYVILEYCNAGDLETLVNAGLILKEK